MPPGFEGGQTPLHMRLPKLSGFKNPNKVVFQVVNLDRIAALFPQGGTIDPDALADAGALLTAGWGWQNDIPTAARRIDRIGSLLDLRAGVHQNHVIAVERQVALGLVCRSKLVVSTLRRRMRTSGKLRSARFIDARLTIFGSTSLP